jgi:hypothetical protein
MEKVEVIVELRNKAEKKCQVDISESAPWKLIFTGVGLVRLEIEADDLFKACVLLRERLEQLGCKLLCNGARKNIIASGMSRQMGGGRKGYIVQLGRPALRSNLVDIFDYADSSLIASIEQQKSFYNKWVSSLSNE